MWCLAVTRMALEALTAAIVVMWTRTITRMRLVRPRVRGTCFVRCILTNINVRVFLFTMIFPAGLSAYRMTLHSVTRIYLAGHIITLNLLVPQINTTNLVQGVVTSTSLVVVAGVVMGVLVPVLDAVILSLSVLVMHGMRPLLFWITRTFLVMVKVTYLRLLVSCRRGKNFSAINDARILALQTGVLGRDEHGRRVPGRRRGGRSGPRGLWAGWHFCLCGAVNTVWRRCVGRAGCGDPIITVDVLCRVRRSGP